MQTATIKTIRIATDGLCTVKTGIFSTTVVLVLALTAALANAAVIINVTEQGGNVVFSATGSLNLTGASFVSNNIYLTGFIPGGPNWYVAPGGGGALDLYALTAFDGAFGTSETFFRIPKSTSGDDFIIWGYNGSPPQQVGVPAGYTSGSAISSGMVYYDATITGFTMIEGTYNYSLPNDTITLNIGIPEPSTLALAGLGLSLITMRRRR